MLGIIGHGTTEIAAVEEEGKLTGTQDGTPSGGHDSVRVLLVADFPARHFNSFVDVHVQQFDKLVMRFRFQRIVHGLTEDNRT